jgi:hypothetical protein
MTITLNGTTGITTPALDSQGVAVVNRQTTDGTIIDLRKDGATVGSIGVGSVNDLYIGRADTGLLFDNSDYIRPWNTSTNAARDAAIDLGVSDSRFKDLYLSGGVYLGGIGSANYLSDYEFGTWVPAATLGFPAAFTTVSANYVKVGSIVHAVAYFKARNDGTSISIGGLPFTPNSFYGWSLGHEAYTVRKEYLDATNSRLTAILSSTSGATYYDFHVSATYYTTA